jgi:hypothetical protein
MMTPDRMGLEGRAPVVAITPGNPEAEKYGKMWARPEYRAVAPGEELAHLFLQHAQPKPGSEVIDFGCGTGRGALMLALPPPMGGGMRVTMVDFVRNCLDPEIQEALTTQSHVLRFVKADLEQKLTVAAEYGYCTDVMEHIPEQKVGRVLQNVLMAARHVFFSISTTEDRCGQLIGETLHLTVQSYAWWLGLFQHLKCSIHFAQDLGTSCLFYVSAWSHGEDVVDTMSLNSTVELVRKNVAHNIAQGWQPVHPHVTNDMEVMILGGGPSMPAFLEDIREKKKHGVKLVTLNGAYNWALAHDLAPLNTIIVDARAFNARFTKPVRDDCTYLIASQCDPAVFAGLPKDRTFIWHTSAEMIQDLLRKQYETSFPVPGGSTVLLRAIPLLRMLGYKRFHLYGCDSCLMTAPDGPETERVHHAYPQPENDDPASIAVNVTGTSRIFHCYPWMISQAQEMQDVIRGLGEEIELEIYGDGLLAYLLRSAAEMWWAEHPNP